MTRTLLATLALLLAAGTLSACSQGGDPEARRGTSGFYSGAGGGVNWR